MRNRPREARPKFFDRVQYHYDPRDAFDLEDVLDGFFVALQTIGISCPIDPDNIILSNVWALDQITLANICRRESNRQESTPVFQRRELSQGQATQNEIPSPVPMAASVATTPEQNDVQPTSPLAQWYRGAEQILDALSPLDPALVHAFLLDYNVVNRSEPYAAFFYQQPGSFVCYTEDEYWHYSPEDRRIFQPIRFIDCIYSTPCAHYSASCTHPDTDLHCDSCARSGSCDRTCADPDIQYYIRSDNPAIVAALVRRELASKTGQAALDLLEEYQIFTRYRSHDPVASVIKQVLASMPPF